jgi:hypothetical protein
MMTESSTLLISTTSRTPMGHPVTKRRRTTIP